MRHLFIARHGDYGFKDLTEKGKHQTEILGKTIKELLNKDSSCIISSNATRALQSAEILASHLGLSEVEQIPDLWSGIGAPEEGYHGYHEENKRLMRMINEKGEQTDGLIMVTHMELIEHFAPYFLREELKQERHFSKISEGQAVHFDKEKRKYQILPK